MNNKFMKKFLKTVLMLTCVAGLTACGAEEKVSDFQQAKVQEAEARAATVVSLTNRLVSESSSDAMLENYGNVELADVFSSLYYQYTQDSSFMCEGKAVRNAVTSFESSIEDIGAITEIGTPSSQVKDDSITVLIPATCENGTGEIELIFTNDIYLKMTSCTLNVDESFGSLMARAGLNTVLGMGTVFIVLILISYIISAFQFIPKLQDKLSKKAEPVKEEASPAEAAVSQVAVSQIESEELSDDLELVAVISAAIAAYEGASGTDGFRVRSIRRAKTSNWKR